MIPVQAQLVERVLGSAGEGQPSTIEALLKMSREGIDAEVHKPITALFLGRCGPAAVLDAVADVTGVVEIIEVVDQGEELWQGLGPEVIQLKVFLPSCDDLRKEAIGTALGEVLTDVRPVLNVVSEGAWW